MEKGAGASIKKVCPQIDWVQGSLILVWCYVSGQNLLLTYHHVWVQDSMGLGGAGLEQELC